MWELINIESILSAIIMSQLTQNLISCEEENYFKEVLNMKNIVLEKGYVDKCNIEKELIVNLLH